MPSDWLAAQPGWLAFVLAGTLLALAGTAVGVIAARRKKERARAARVRSPAPARQHIEVASAGGTAVTGRPSPEGLRRLGAEIDARAARLEALIRQADGRIAALAEATRPAAAAARAGEACPPEPPPLRVSLRPRAPDPLTQAVCERADGGMTAVQIARELDEQVGKVELILALRGARPGA